MANLTITIEDEVLRKARMRALEQETSVNARRSSSTSAIPSPSGTP